MQSITLSRTRLTRTRTIILGLIVIIIALVATVLIVLERDASLVASYNSLASKYNRAIRQPPAIIPPPNSSIVNPDTPTPPPDMVVWNSCFTSFGCKMNASGWRQYIVPDTFDLYVSFTSNVSIVVYFLTLPQYSQLIYGGRISDVSGAYQSIPASTIVSDWVFKLAEGCADYVAIFRSLANGVMHPSISITHNPASTWTGICQVTGPSG